MVSNRPTDKRTTTLPIEPGAEQTRDRALCLFKYLHDLVSIRSKAVYSIDQYEEVLWLNDIPREPGCYCAAWSDRKESSDIWIEVGKPRLKHPPKVPDRLEPWLDPKEVEDSSLEMPELCERIVAPTISENVGDELDNQSKFEELVDHPEIKPLWEKYVENQWWPWSSEDRRLRGIQDIYSSLFSIYQKQQRLGESYEVVLGFGLLTWQIPERQDVKRHVITAQTNITFDVNRGVITLGAAGEGARLTIESEMLDPKYQPDAKEQETIKEHLAEVGDEIWEGVGLRETLCSWVQAVSPKGSFTDTLVPQEKTGNDPVINFAPAIILRKRTEHSLLRILREIAERIAEGINVPTGVDRLTRIIDDLDDSDVFQTKDSGAVILRSTDSEIYFPLEANEEQRRIAQRLATRQGVLVQGPPGTGKSHTIANLVCHLLAQGKRVLVTSHTPRALKVLRKKFPPQIADLCVVLLGDDVEAMRELENSVSGITTKYSNWKPEVNRFRIENLERQLDDARSKEAVLVGELRAIREADSYRHPTCFGNYQGTSQEIALMVSREAQDYEWLDVSPDEGQEPPLSNEESRTLLDSLRHVDEAKLAELPMSIIDTEELIAPKRFIELVEEERKAKERYEQEHYNRAYPGYEQLETTSAELRQRLSSKLQVFVESYSKTQEAAEPWVCEAATNILAGRTSIWVELHESTKQHLDVIRGLVREASARKITGLDQRDLSCVKADAEALLSHLENGGKLGVSIFRPHVVKAGLYLIKEARVDGRICSNQEALKALLTWIEVNQHLDIMRQDWEPYAQAQKGSLAVQFAEYQDNYRVLESTLSLRPMADDLKELVCTVKGLRIPTWCLGESVIALQKALDAVDVGESLATTSSKFDKLVSALRTVMDGPDPHRIVAELLEIVGRRDVERYRTAYYSLAEIHKEKSAFAEQKALMERLSEAAPSLMSELASDPANGEWTKRMADFEAAWNWRRADIWLKKLNDPEAQVRIGNELAQVRKKISSLLADLASEKAWGHCLEQLTEGQRQHLIAWSTAMRKVGKGKGKYAERHRREARAHMDECRAAIPAWIMPVYRVAETVKAEAGIFDVVIIDEASQSGPEALFLQFLAKKIVVVGDDKQISPSSVGVHRDDVELLRKKHISDLPHSDMLGADNSFFDQAMIRYGGRICLREHFRCMPEIIQFSNNLCYRAEPLIPLRQYGSHRLAPVVITRHIADGYIKGDRNINPSEAKAIVDQIKACCSDPSYEGKTMGVISLLGSYHAQYIESILIKELGPEEMEKRELISGDAYAFQGDERDVIFLSLVAAPAEGRHIAALVKKSDHQRFNVAASRAKDQLWLFHSATLSDLNPDCVRYRLLDYCLDPRVDATSVDGVDINQLRESAKSNRRNREEPPDPFDSWFEVDVFLKLIDRGYRVIPQYKIAGYSIDLVVEGMNCRLAVECDGDQYHGADRFEADTAREKDLIRCGLTFFRIRGCVFYRDQDSALEDLWRVLKERGISPSATSDSFEEPSEREEEPLVLTSADIISLDRCKDEEDGAKQVEMGIAQPTGNHIVVEETGGYESSTGETNNKPTIMRSYRSWAARPLPDPRRASTEAVMAGLLEIIEAEGPIQCYLAYSRYVKAAGISKVGKQIREALIQATGMAYRKKLVEQRNEAGTRFRDDKILRKTGTPPVVVRERGDRTFSEIPPAEVAMLMNYLKDKHPTISDEKLFRMVLDCYGLSRMTPVTRAQLKKIYTCRLQL